MSDVVLVALIAAVPSTLVAVPGLVTARRTRRQIAEVAHETRPNSGLSMFDRVARTEGKVDLLAVEVRDLVKRLDRHLDR